MGFWDSLVGRKRLSSPEEVREALFDAGARGDERALAPQQRATEDTPIASAAGRRERRRAGRLGGCAAARRRTGNARPADIRAVPMASDDPMTISAAHWNRIRGGELYAASSRIEWAVLLRRTHGLDALRGRLARM